ncbi:MAG: NAD(P)/FAD-dependent oxidoreductase [Clostridiales Family XIII bacterium]|jgi:2,4-dienoyl-CoA reductase-like NADH-dependent reductase (Old Yellow Enzyme family)/thioredoxin reductase|nr:NAD(P)/FAD-dependent oxidoreductase [Clostridiales Family XIII bacterium]
MGSNLEHVLSPIKIGNLELKNRLQSAPHCFMLATPDGYVTREMIAYFRNIAKGGVGLITMGETPIDRKSAPAHNYSLNVGDDKIIHGLCETIEAVQKFGAKLSVELNHSGRIKLNGDPALGPSNIPTPLELELAAEQGREPRPVIEMTKDMIDEIIDEYAEGALRCKKAGMEIVMLHTGHGHLLSSFLSPISNHRTDAYGGSFENRARFAIEVIDEVRNRCGDKLAIELRISGNELTPGGLDEDDMVKFINMIEGKVDLVNVSAGLLGDNWIISDQIQPTYWPHCYHVHRAEYIKQRVNVPISTVGSIPDIQTADEIIRDGKADIVAMARALIVDPEMVNKAQAGQFEDIRPCMRCFMCNKKTRNFYPIRCSGNPVTGRELDYAELRPALVKKKVVIVGGGPAGMEAAITASKKGHDVILYEKSDKLGGNFNYAAGLEIKADVKRFLEYLVLQTKKTPNLDIRLGVEATPEKVKADAPDAIIVAVGSDPLIPGAIPGIQGENVVWVGDIDSGKATVGDNVVVVGAGTTGAETALQLTINGKKVTVIDLLDYKKQIAPEYPRGLTRKITEYAIPILDHTKLEEITPVGVNVLTPDGHQETIAADTVVLSLGFRPRKALAHSFDGIVPEIYHIGDVVRIGDVYNAIHDGFDIAVEI